MLYGFHFRGQSQFRGEEGKLSPKEVSWIQHFTLLVLSFQLPCCSLHQSKVAETSPLEEMWSAGFRRPHWARWIRASRELQSLCQCTYMCLHHFSSLWLSMLLEGGHYTMSWNVLVDLLYAVRSATIDYYQVVKLYLAHIHVAITYQEDFVCVACYEGKQKTHK